MSEQDAVPRRPLFVVVIPDETELVQVRPSAQDGPFDEVAKLLFFVTAAPGKPAKVTVPGRERSYGKYRSSSLSQIKKYINLVH